jgi:hypothetical protein
MKAEVEVARSDNVEQLLRVAEELLLSVNVLVENWAANCGSEKGQRRAETNERAPSSSPLRFLGPSLRGAKGATGPEAFPRVTIVPFLLDGKGRVSSLTEPASKAKRRD